MHTASAVAPCRRGQTGRETPPRDASPVYTPRRPAATVDAAGPRSGRRRRTSEAGERKKRNNDEQNQKIDSRRDVDVARDLKSSLVSPFAPTTPPRSASAAAERPRPGRSDSQDRAPQGVPPIDKVACSVINLSQDRAHSSTQRERDARMPQAALHVCAFCAPVVPAVLWCPGHPAPSLRLFSARRPPHGYLTVHL